MNYIVSLINDIEGAMGFNRSWYMDKDKEAFFWVMLDATQVKQHCLSATIMNYCLCDVTVTPNTTVVIVKMLV